MVAIGISIQIPAIQTKLVQFATKQLSQKLNTQVSIQHVNIKFFNAVEFHKLSY